MNDERMESLLEVIEGLIKTVERQDKEIRDMQNAIISASEMLDSHNEGINLILQVLNANGLIDVDI